MQIECERKYLDVDFSELRQKLVTLMASNIGICFESNFILDTRDRQLMDEKRLLRLRQKEYRDKTSCILTYKESVFFNDAKNKIKKEYETSLGDMKEALLIFEKLGYEIIGQYEKIREEWQVEINHGNGNCASCHIDLDEMNFMNVAEVEGPATIIDDCAHLLGLEKYKSSASNYFDLYNDWQNRNGLPLSNSMMFEKKKRERLRGILGLP